MELILLWQPEKCEITLQKEGILSSSYLAHMLFKTVCLTVVTMFTMKMLLPWQHKDIQQFCYEKLF